MTNWSFLTTHARVLLTLASDPEIRLRDIASAVGVTERRAHAIVTDLTEDGYVTKHRRGRRNRYEIQPDRELKDEVIKLPVGDVLNLLAHTTNSSQNTERR